MENIKLEKLNGLYKVYYEVKHNYPDKQKLVDIKWDELLHDYEKLVVDSKTTYEYYSILMRYISLVNDGHTNIMPPWMINPPGFGKPAIELEWINNEIVISRVGNVKELKEYNIKCGDIITHIDSKPVQDVMKEINLMYARGSEQANNKINTYFLLLGEVSKKVSVKLEKFEEKIDLNRSIIQDDGEYFIDRFIDFNNPYSIKKLDNDIYYINILSFSTMSIADSIVEVLNANPKGLIIDLRLNLGGNDKIMNKIISFMIKEPVKSPIWSCDFYNQAFELWGQEYPSKEIQNTIEPAEGKPYNNSVVVLTSGMTSSTAEDMVIILKETKRATIIGGRTAGSSGNPKNFKLPYGGTLRVSSFKPLTPSGKEYLGLGIEPNIECSDTIESIKSGRDMIVEKAIALIN